MKNFHSFFRCLPRRRTNSFDDSGKRTRSDRDVALVLKTSRIVLFAATVLILSRNHLRSRSARTAIVTLGHTEDNMKRIVGSLAVVALIAAAAGCSLNATGPVGVTKDASLVAGCENLGDVAVSPNT